MRKINFRRFSAATLAVAATAALTLGSTSTEAWGGKTTSWDVTGNSNAGKTTSWDVTGNSIAGKTTSWDLAQSGKTTSWD